jgi:plastocyanin
MTRRLNTAGSMASVIRAAVTACTLAAGGSAAAVQLTVQVVNSAGQPVVDAGVYAILLSATPPLRPKREISIEQSNKQFVPLVSIAQTGTMVNFPNRDPFRHHVYSFSPAKTFEIKLYSGVPARPVVFDKPGEVVLGCNIHDTMIAHVLIVDTPFFAKTDGQGRALLDQLPAGDYELRMWYPGAAGLPAAQKIKLGAMEAITTSFTFAGKPAAPAAAK